MGGFVIITNLCRRIDCSLVLSIPMNAAAHLLALSLIHLVRHLQEDLEESYY